MWAESGAEAFRHLAVSGRSQARKARGARTGITFTRSGALVSPCESRRRSSLSAVRTNLSQGGNTPMCGCERIAGVR